MISPSFSLWLNEGFATYSMFESISKMDWDISNAMMSRFMTTRFAPVMISDGYETSNPIRPTNLNHPLDIRSQFSSIPYSKGDDYLNYLI